MIRLMTGTPGSGKSLNVARLLIIKARIGKRIIANFPIRPTTKQIKKGRQPEYWPNETITPDRLLDYARRHHKYGKEGQTVLVIDECQLVFNCREYKDSNRLKWIEFFSQHRKFGFDVILVTQHDRLIDRQIRAFVEYNVIHRKMNNFGFPGFVMTLLHINAFVAVDYWYGMRERLGAEMFVYRKKLGRVYDSYQDFRLGTAAWGDGEGPASAGGDLSSQVAERPEVESDNMPLPPHIFETTEWGVRPKPLQTREPA